MPPDKWKGRERHRHDAAARIVNHLRQKPRQRTLVSPESNLPPYSVQDVSQRSDARIAEVLR
jgi:hypothetical protein